MSGAVDYKECPRGGGEGKCRCGKCAVCGWPKHSAVHGPLFRCEPGTKSWGHDFVPVSTPAKGVEAGGGR